MCNYEALRPDKLRDHKRNKHGVDVSMRGARGGGVKYMIDPETGSMERTQVKKKKKKTEPKMEPGFMIDPETGSLIPCDTGAMVRIRFDISMIFYLISIKIVAH